MTDRKIILGMALTDGYGTLPDAWRAPHVDPENYAKVEANIRYTQSAERGGFAFVFTPDFPAVRGGLGRAPVNNIMDPLMEAAVISQATSNIGFVLTGSTTFQVPFNTARQFKTLDIMSHGRAGWNAVTTSDQLVAANYGRPVADRAERYQRAHESIQIVQSLWGSWGEDAWIHDQESGHFIDPTKLQPINLGGKHVASRGPLPLPPSEQSQPVVFASGGPSPHQLELAGRYADGFITEVWTIEQARSARTALRRATEEAGRNPDDMKFFVGIMTTLAPTVREGLDRRMLMSGEVIEARLPHLSAMIGVPLQPRDIDVPLTQEQLSVIRASPQDPRSEIAVRVAREGWSPRDILAHGVIDYHPVTVGPGHVHADHMQEWFEAGAADGFWTMPDVYEDGVDAFVDEVVPILRDRGLYPDEYAGSTLRENLSVPEQYGLGGWVK